ncbi:hypothetical protein IBX73_11865 [candidate division WOR-3 bacterium]|nr:hypothetical protein [candidate division WOR-3 bacterium]
MLFFRRENRYVLDSSSILDGRILQLFSKEFYEGRIYIPKLVQEVASRVLGPDFEKTLAGPGGSTTVEIIAGKSEGSSEEIQVISVAGKKKATVFTASDELCRQARSYPAVKVIDIRALYRTLTPIFVPNRLIAVRILKRGLRQNEGIGYIEGVKIVVEHAAKYVNQVVNARVLTMISSDKGSLVFCSLEDGSVNTTA